VWPERICAHRRLQSEKAELKPNHSYCFSSPGGVSSHHVFSHQAPDPAYDSVRRIAGRTTNREAVLGQSISLRKEAQLFQDTGLQGVPGLQGRIREVHEGGSAH
jgi:hypothetical protein